MIELAYGVNHEIAAWVANNIQGCERGFDKPVSIGVIRNGAIIGGVVYHNWHPESGVIEMSAAAADSRWLMGPTLHAIFEYPFQQLDCQLVVLRVSERNDRMVKIAFRFGFEGYLIPRLRGRDEGEYLFTLTKERWLKTPQEIKRHGQVLSAASA